MPFQEVEDVVFEVAAQAQLLSILLGLDVVFEHELAIRSFTTLDALFVAGTS